MTVSRRKFARLAAAFVCRCCGFARDRATTRDQVAALQHGELPQVRSTACGGPALTISKFVNEMSDGKFVIDPFGPGEIVPGLQVLDAVANGTVECGHTYAGYYIGK